MAKIANASTVVGKCNKNWWLIDAEGIPMGRLASRIALVLRGKNRVDYTPFSDCGDHVVVINASKVAITGNKLNYKRFLWHTGYPGGIKERVWIDILRGSHPERLLYKSIERMMPKDSPLARKQMRSLHVYAGTDHPHTGQLPKSVVLCEART
jgi:large subunit ribosomal protein L13